MFFCLSFAKSPDLFNTFFSNKPSVEKLDQSQLYFADEHIELLRQSRGDSLLSRYTFDKQSVDYTQILKKSTYKITYSLNTLNTSDLLNNEYIESDPQLRAHTVGIRSQFNIQKTTFIPGFQFTYSATEDTLLIKKFPQSDRSIYNNYFFDLLPPTIGDTIEYRNNSKNMDIELLVEKMDENKGFTAYLHYSLFTNSLIEDHYNSGNVVKLQGPRSTYNFLRFSTLNGYFALKLNTNSIVKAGIDISSAPLNWSHTIFPNDPDTLEIIQLARSQIHSFSCKLAYELIKRSLHVDISLNAGRVTGDAHLSTPVLGYIFGILPISHQGDVEMRTQYLHSILHIDYPINFRHLSIYPRLDILSGFYESHLSALALLQFGIEDINFEENYVHVARIVSFGLNSIIEFNSNFYLDLDISQLIPIIKQLSPEPEPIEPSNIKQYGGLSISLGVGMTW